MAKTVVYHNHVIKSVPDKLYNQEWRAQIVIIWKSGRAMDSRHFTPAGTFKSEQDADRSGISFGQRIIDKESSSHHTPRVSE